MEDIVEQPGIPARRHFIRGLGGIGIAALFAPKETFAQRKQEKGEEQVSTNEDLMREHGILKRVMLCYEEIIRR
ncbi:MAG: hypothetical protein JOY88_04210, partial [Pelomonas sp.]|nr:hypothetical protein [Roseateles sp.]